MGMPGAVNTSAAARVDRFWAKYPFAPLGSISCGTRARPFDTSSCDSL